MATPITAGAVGLEALKLVRGDAGRGRGRAAASWASWRRSSPASLAIAVLLRYVRTRSFNVFVVYRVVLAAVVLVVFLPR